MSQSGSASLLEFYLFMMAPALRRVFQQVLR